jgi:hypothetical protein
MSIAADVVIRSTSVADPPMYDETLLSHQQAMLDACRSGNLERLQQLFLKHNIKQGDSPVKESWIRDLTAPTSGPPKYIRETALQYGPPPTDELIQAAISAKKPIIILFLLKTYPKFNFWDSKIMDTALTHQDVYTFKAMYAYDKRVLGYDDHMKTALTLTLEEEGTSLANFLLDNFACVNDIGWPCQGAAINAAISDGQQLEVIERILEKNLDGIEMSCAATFAVWSSRIDVLKLFRDRGYLRPEYLSDESLVRGLERAWKWKNDKMVIFLEDCLEERRVQARAEKPEQSKKCEESKQNEAKDKVQYGEKSSPGEKDSGGSTWWHIWR